MPDSGRHSRFSATKAGCKGEAWGKARTARRSCLVEPASCRFCVSVRPFGHFLNQNICLKSNVTPNRMALCDSCALSWPISGQRKNSHKRAPCFAPSTPLRASQDKQSSQKVFHECRAAATSPPGGVPSTLYFRNCYKKQEDVNRRSPQSGASAKLATPWRGQQRGELRSYLAFFAIFCSTLLWVVGVAHFGSTRSTRL